jgi:nitrite reductase/ring-hydroxylating ferredoxin subunit
LQAHDGSAYRWPAASPDETLAGVTRGTPCGEYLRRYWHPVAASSAVTSTPQLVKVLGEELVLFRNGAGQAGLLYPRCMHRGTSLHYGRVEQAGIRCCYHGWLFSPQGQCLDQPCEPGGGLHRERIRQPWYPVEERYGLVFAYLGPLERKPLLPHYDVLEDLEDGEFIEVDATGYGGYIAPVADPVIPYHWLQNWENTMDPFHVHVLHTTFSGPQFTPDFGVLPDVAFERFDGGVLYRAVRTGEGGSRMTRVNAVLYPNISATPSLDLLPNRGRSLCWHVPVDETSFRMIFAAARKEPGRYAGRRMHNGKFWTEATPQERRDFPGDFEAQSGQGRITLHSEEHLASSDVGIGMLRRGMKKQIAAVAEGGDPAGVAYEEVARLVRVPSGNFTGQA